MPTYVIIDATRDEESPYGVVRETITASTADEAWDRQTTEGELFIKCGPRRPSRAESVLGTGAN